MRFIGRIPQLKRLEKRPAVLFYNRLMRRLCAILCSVQLAWACETAPPLWSVQSPDADPFYRIVQNGKVGYIDNQGRIVVAPTLDEWVTGEFHNGLLVTGVSDGPYIDATGKKVLDTGFHRNWDFSEGLAVAMREVYRQKMGLHRHPRQLCDSPTI